MSRLIGRAGSQPSGARAVGRHLPEVELSYRITASSFLVHPATPNAGFCLIVASDSRSTNTDGTVFVMFTTARVATFTVQ